jgi:hypothetical protein
MTLPAEPLISLIRRYRVYRATEANAKGSPRADKTLAMAQGIA